MGRLRTYRELLPCSKCSRGVALVVGLPFFTTSLGAGEQPKSLTPTEQYEALLKDYQLGSAAWKESGKGLTLADPRWIEHHAAWPKWSFGPRFLQFAEANQKKPEALEALLQVVGMLESGHNGDRCFFPVMTRTFRICGRRLSARRAGRSGVPGKGEAT